MSTDIRNDSRWVAAVSSAAMIAPSLIDAMTLIVPFPSDRERYISIDGSWRASVGNAFWTLSRERRNFCIIHITMHMVCHQFERASSANIPLDRNGLRAMSLEIDPSILRIDGTRAINDSDDGDLPQYRTMEEYYPLIMNGRSERPRRGSSSSSDNGTGIDDAQRDARGNRHPEPSDNDDGGHGDAGQKTGNGRSNEADQSSNGDGGGVGESQGIGEQSQQDDNPNGESTPQEVSRDADLHGVSRPMPSSVINALNNTTERMKRGSAMAGNGMSIDQPVADLVLSHITVPKENWRVILQHIMSMNKARKSYQSTERTFSKINVRAAAFFDDIIMPGLTSYIPKIIMALDTSGSMGTDDIMKALSEAEEIMRNGSDFKVFCIDKKMKSVQPVSSIDQLDVTGGGGTDMAPAFEYIRSLSRYQRPDVFVLATDAFVPWQHCEHVMPTYDCMIIILVVNKMGLERIPQWLRDRSEILDISA